MEYYAEFREQVIEVDDDSDTDPNNTPPNE